MSEFDLYKLAAIDETVSHFFFPALALVPRREREKQQLLQQQQQQQQQQNNAERSSNGDEDGAAAASASNRPSPSMLTDEAVKKEKNHHHHLPNHQEDDDEEDEEPIRIPDTILYSYSKPIVWFYYDEATKRILRRPSKYLNTQTILEHFSEASRGITGVKAWYVFPQEPELITPQTSDFPVDILSQDAVGPTGLLRFLQCPKGKGILQNFVENKTESDGSMRNVYIHCDFSPVHFSTQLYVSAKPLSVTNAVDAKKKGKKSSSGGNSGGGGGAAGRMAGVNLALRFSPYSSPYERRSLVSSALNTRLRNVCRSIARRLDATLHYHLASMQVVCRIDSEDRLYVLWCSSMRMHAPQRYPQLSFRLSPQGTLHEPYSFAERNKSTTTSGGVLDDVDKEEDNNNNNTIIGGSGGVGLAQGTTNAARNRNTNSIGTMNNASVGNDASSAFVDDERDAAMIVLRLLSNLVPERPTTTTRVTTSPSRKTPTNDSSTANFAGSSGVGGTKDGESPPSSSSPTSPRSFEHQMIRCCVCREERQRGALVKVQLQWVLYCMNLMDRAAGSHWDSHADVPPSVALVCPNLSKSQFTLLVALDKHRHWLQTIVGVCVDCITDCNRANDIITEQKVVMPSWLAIDSHFGTAAGRRGTSRNSLQSSTRLSEREGRRATARIADMLTYFHHAGDNETATDNETLVTLKAVVNVVPQISSSSGGGGGGSSGGAAALDGSRSHGVTSAASGHAAGSSHLTSSVLWSKHHDDADRHLRRKTMMMQASVAEWKNNQALTFVGATREHTDAADLYKLERGVWRRCGFGRPKVDSRFVPPVAHVYSACILNDDTSTKNLRTSLERIADMDEKQRLLSLSCAIGGGGGGNGSADVDGPEVPCHTPL